MNSRNIFTWVTATVLASGVGVALAGDQGDWILRGGVTMVDPDTSNDSELQGNLDGAELSVDDDSQLGINVVYYFADGFAIELLAATPFKHDIELQDTGVIGSAKHLPPTLSALYDLPLPAGAPVNVYLGLGLNYTWFLEDESRLGALDLDDSMGLSAQVGADFPINDSFGANVSVRWIDINTDVDLGGENLGELEIDPWVYSIGLNYMF